MALLNQRENEYALFTGWYGDCEDSCNTFDLTPHVNEIYAVYQFTEDAKGVKTFLSSALFAVLYFCILLILRLGS